MDTQHIQQKAEKLRIAAIQYALEEHADVPALESIARFRSAYASLNDRIREANQRTDHVVRVKTVYDPLESAWQARKKELAVAKGNLDNLCRPLGETAFEAYLAGSIENQPVFLQRLAAHERIATFQKEKDQLAPPSDASFLQKAKAKALQLPILGKISFEETKLGRLEGNIGRQLIASNSEDSVRCELTADVLAQIVAHREACSQHEQALGCFETKRQELGQELNLAIDNEASLSAELDRSKQQVAQLEQERLNLEQQFLQELLTEVALPKEGRLAELLQDFAQTSRRCRR